MATATFDGVTLTIRPRSDRWAIAQVGDEINEFLADMNRMILRATAATDPHQHMLACNLMTVRPLPGERE